MESATIESRDVVTEAELRRAREAIKSGQTAQAAALADAIQGAAADADRTQDDDGPELPGATATYSPDDNKLRLYPAGRLSREDYDRVKAAGFSWAPKQGLFVAPKWTPDREDLLISLCGEVGDEDTSLVERAEERAERFEGYSERRENEAERAREAVSSLAGSIPLGQPILVGHHSERHARRDAEKIRNGMSRAVKLWKTSEYWARRASGAIRAAKYKERPDVRARRIKGLEADLRKIKRTREEHEAALKLWNSGLDLEKARRLTGCSHLLGYLPCVEDRPGHWWHAYDVLRPDGERYKECPSMTLEQVVEAANRHLPEQIARCDRWIEHYEGRLAYERAMLGEQGGTVADKTKPEKGGACRCWASPGYGKGWSFIQKVNRVSVTVHDNWNNGGKNFARTIPFDKLRAVMTAAEVQAAKDAGRVVETKNGTGFYLKDAEPEPARHTPKPEPTAFDAMEKSLAAGVQVVAANQLFPTPPELAVRLVDLAGMRPGMTVLEPSAGTGALMRAIFEAEPLQVYAVEINRDLADRLPSVAQNLRDNGNGIGTDTSLLYRCSDFLTLTPEHVGTFDRVVMNPPFANAQDIQHIRHALKFVKPGGRLVAICANGPRQREAFQGIADLWEDLEPGAFAASGTNVRAAIVVFEC